MMKAQKAGTYNIRNNVSCQFGTYFASGDNNKSISIYSAYTQKTALSDF